jgi:hypothetical protein
MTLITMMTMMKMENGERNMEMSPTSKNALKIGGALILIALFLVCGPLKGRFGSGGKGVEEAPSVASGPPLDPVELDTTGAVEAVAAGALVGASTPPLETAAPLPSVTNEDDSPALPIVVAATTGAAAGAAVAADSSGGSGGSVLPPVSAGVPPTNVASEEMPGVAAAAAAVSAFDDSMETSDLGQAGSAATRFPPPVAEGGDALLALSTEPFGMDSGKLLQACDSPGSGCQRLTSGGASRNFPPAQSGPPRSRNFPPAQSGSPRGGNTP